MKIKLKLNFLLVLCLFIFSFGILGFHNVKAASGPGIVVSPNYPKEQIKENGIFNVIFQPNHHYNLILKIANNNNESKTVTISPNTAYTTNSGGIAFDNPNATSNLPKKYNFHSLFDQKERKVTIPANSTDKVSFGLKMPSNLYKGIITGGFYVTIPNDNKSNVKNNVNIENRFSYGLATVIHDNKEKARSKVQLNNVTLNNNDNQMQVDSNIRNVNAGIISGMNVNSKIIKDSNNKVVSKSSRNNLSMAPNSSFNYEDTIENSLSPGSYKVHLNITDDSGHTWNESKNFRVNTREYVTHFTQKVPWTLYILIGVIVLLALIIILLVYNQFRNKHKKNDQSNQSKNNTKN